MTGFPTISRRDMLLQSGTGFGALALAGLLGQDGYGAQSADQTKPRHHGAKARSVIFLFMEGGPSHMDLTDPKPLLTEMAGQALPKSFKPVITPMG